MNEQEQKKLDKDLETLFGSTSIRPKKDTDRLKRFGGTDEPVVASSNPNQGKKPYQDYNEKYDDKKEPENIEKQKPKKSKFGRNALIVGCVVIAVVGWHGIEAIRANQASKAAAYYTQNKDECYQAYCQQEGKDPNSEETRREFDHLYDEGRILYDDGQVIIISGRGN